MGGKEILNEGEKNKAVANKTKERGRRDHSSEPRKRVGLWGIKGEHGRKDKRVGKEKNWAGEHSSWGTRREPRTSRGKKSRRTENPHKRHFDHPKLRYQEKDCKRGGGKEANPGLKVLS